MGILKKLLSGKKPASGVKVGERRPDAMAAKKKAPKDKGAKAESPKGKAFSGKGAETAPSETSQPSAKAASADHFETPMNPEEIIREAMRIGKKKLTDDAEREDREVFAKEVESSVEHEEDEDETSAKVKNEEIIRETLKLREKRIAEEKQAAKDSPCAEKKSPLAEPEAEKPDSREEFIRMALQICEEKQELLGDIDPELREKLSRAVMAKFMKAKGGDQ